MEEKTFETINLVLLDGSNVAISYPEDCEYFNEVYDEMIAAIENGEFWYVGNWTDWKAIWKTLPLQYLNCRLVVGSY